ncbi:hypothetical protein GCM10025876_04180 [Demequina litorisediminis]|uniref:Uncharacterized protein n=1 Tax=Demequina litorisediminis TaxID=1849022 RepID=A0ABQ6IBU5_9MICO|nr:hypothetical protein GCM10025876_04180 [Demequina litorisediminis]
MPPNPNVIRVITNAPAATIKPVICRLSLLLAMEVDERAALAENQPDDEWCDKAEEPCRDHHGDAGHEVNQHRVHAGVGLEHRLGCGRAVLGRVLRPWGLLIAAVGRLVGRGRGHGSAGGGGAVG